MFWLSQMYEFAGGFFKHEILPKILSIGFLTIYDNGYSIKIVENREKNKYLIDCFPWLLEICTQRRKRKNIGKNNPYPRNLTVK